MKVLYIAASLLVVGTILRVNGRTNRIKHLGYMMLMVGATWTFFGMIRYYL